MFVLSPLLLVEILGQRATCPNQKKEIKTLATSLQDLPSAGPMLLTKCRVVLLYSGSLQVQQGAVFFRVSEECLRTPHKDSMWKEIREVSRGLPKSRHWWRLDEQKEKAPL